MRRNHEPFWMMRARLAVHALYVRRRLRPHFDALGPGALFFRPWYVHVHGPSITAGRFLHVVAERGREVALSVWTDGASHGRIEIGDYGLLLPGVRIQSAARVRLGAGCMLASDAYLTDADWHDIHDRSREVGATAPILIDDNVWIGDGAFVGKGVHIGENSVVGARAVVTRDVPAGVIVAGNPARVVRELNRDQPFVTRAALFDAAPDEVAARNAYLQWLGLRENTTAGWLRSTLFPRPTD